MDPDIHTFVCHDQPCHPCRPSLDLQALTSKPAHTCSPTIVTACMQNLLSQSHYRMCLHLVRLKMSQFSHVWGPPAPPPCMTCMSLAWPVRQHAYSHCAKPKSRRASGSSAIAHYNSLFSTFYAFSTCSCPKVPEQSEKITFPQLTDEMQACRLHQ